MEKGEYKEIAKKHNIATKAAEKMLLIARNASLEKRLQSLQEDNERLRKLLSEVSRQFQSDGIGECEPMVLLSKIEQALQQKDNVVGRSEQLLAFAKWHAKEPFTLEEYQDLSKRIKRYLSQ